MKNYSPYRCVIADDDPSFLFLLSRYIKEVPKLYLYGEFLDSRNTIDSISEEDKIDFLFLDIRMGNITGLDVARHLREKVRFIIFVTVSGEYALEAIQLGGDHYLIKPFTFERFLEIVNGVLKRHRRLRTKVSSTNAG